MMYMRTLAFVALGWTVDASPVGYRPAMQYARRFEHYYNGSGMVDSSRVESTSDHLIPSPSSATSSSLLATFSTDDVYEAVGPALLTAITPLTPYTLFQTLPAITFQNTQGHPVITQGFTVVAETSYLRVADASPSLPPSAYSLPLHFIPLSQNGQGGFSYAPSDGRADATSLSLQTSSLTLAASPTISSISTSHITSDSILTTPTIIYSVVSSGESSSPYVIAPSYTPPTYLTTSSKMSSRTAQTTSASPLNTPTSIYSVISSKASSSPHVIAPDYTPPVYLSTSKKTSSREAQATSASALTTPTIIYSVTSDKSSSSPYLIAPGYTPPIYLTTSKKTSSKILQTASASTLESTSSQHGLNSSSGQYTPPILTSTSTFKSIESPRSGHGSSQSTTEFTEYSLITPSSPGMPAPSKPALYSLITSNATPTAASGQADSSDLNASPTSYSSVLDTTASSSHGVAAGYSRHFTLIIPTSSSDLVERPSTSVPTPSSPDAASPTSTHQRVVESVTTTSPSSSRSLASSSRSTLAAPTTTPHVPYYPYHPDLPGDSLSPSPSPSPSSSSSSSSSTSHIGARSSSSDATTSARSAVSTVKATTTSSKSAGGITIVPIDPSGFITVTQTVTVAQETVTVTETVSSC